MATAEAKKKNKGKGKGKPFIPRKRGSHYNEKRDAIIREVIETMTACQWRSGKSNLDLMAKHGISNSAAREYASEASRFIRLASDPDSIMQRLDSAVELGIQLALSAKQGQYDQSRGAWHERPSPNLSALAQLVRNMAEWHGLTRSAKDESRGADGTVEISTEELNSLLSDAGLEVRKKDTR